MKQMFETPRNWGFQVSETRLSWMDAGFSYIDQD